MTNSTCYIVDFDSTTTYIELFIENEPKYTICIGIFLMCCSCVGFNSSTNIISHLITLKHNFCNGKLHLCCCWLRLNNSTIRISHYKRHNNTSSSMEYRLCVVVESDSTTTQHKLNIPAQNTWKYVFWNDKFHFCYCWFWFNSSTNWIFYRRQLTWSLRRVRPDSSQLALVVAPTSPSPSPPRGDL